MGDDDQALYRFRGATVENFVEFPARCRKYLGLKPRAIVLGTNYRSRKEIITFCSRFISHPYCNWRKGGGRGSYRVTTKKITADSSDIGTAVIASTPGKPVEVAAETASLVRRILNEGYVQDPNQIAFLFPSLHSPQVQRMQEALEAENLEVYAPRAGNFLDVPESVAVFGLFFHVFGCPEHDHSGFQNWITTVHRNGQSLLRADTNMKTFVEVRRNEAKQATSDFIALERATERAGWQLHQDYNPSAMRQILLSARGLSDRALRLLRARTLIS